MKATRIFALAIAASMAMVMAPAAEEETVLIGYSSNANDENERSKMDAFEDFVNDWNEEGNTPKLEAVITIADTSVDKQISDVESMVERGVKAVALSSVDAEGMLTTAQSLLDQGIPVIEERGMVLDGVINFDICDEVLMGEMAYEWYDAWLQEHPDVTLNIGKIYGFAAQTANAVRVDRLMELLEENYPDRINVLETQYCDWDTQKAMECMENWGQKYSDGEMNCIIAAGAMMACGASSAILGGGGTPDDYLITAWDATQDVLFELHEGNVDMSIGIDAYKAGYQAAEITAKAALGEEMENHYAADSSTLFPVDATNIDEYYTE